MLVYSFPAAAGVALSAEDDYERILFPVSAVPPGADFGVRIRGDSMQPTIQDGTIVFVRKQPELQNGQIGIFMNLEEKLVYAVALGDDQGIGVGMSAYGTGRVLSVPCGDGLLGRVVDPLGMPLDGSDHIPDMEYRPLEMPAPPILSRKPVTKPLQTGLLSIDAMVPIGRGQRELIIGDRQTGKTSIAVDTILNQKGGNVVCIYVAIGQKASSVAQMITHLRDAGAMDYTIVVCATAADSATMQYIAPYAGCAMGEWYMYKGRDVLIVYDDLSKHDGAPEHYLWIAAAYAQTGTSGSGGSAFGAVLPYGA